MAADSLSRLRLAQTTSLASHGILKRWVLLALGASLLWVFLNTLSMLRYPTVTSDESLVALVAYRYTPAGQLSTVSQFDPFGAYPFRLYLQGLARWFTVFGLGLAQGRAFSLLAGYLAGWVMFLWGTKMYNARIGCLAAILLWFTPRVFWTSHFVRPEMWVAVANIGCLLMGWWLLNRATIWRAGLVGFISIAIWDVYLSTVATTISVGLFILIWCFRQRRWTVLGAFGLGALLGGLYYLGVQFLPDWPQALADWQNWLSLTGRIGSEAGVGWWQRLLQTPVTLFRFYVEYSRIGWLELTYFCVATFLLFRRRTLADIYLLVSTAVAFLIFALLFATGYHALDAVPGPILIVSAGLVPGVEFIGQTLAARWQKGISGTVLLGLVSLPLIGAYGGLSLFYWWTNRDYDYASYIQRLQLLVPPQASVLGQGSWWWGFTEQPYWWDETLETYDERTSSEAQTLVASTMQTHRIEAVLVDDNLGMEITQSPNSVTRMALTDYLTENCHLQGEVSQIGYGIDWGGPGVILTRVYLCDH